MAHSVYHWTPSDTHSKRLFNIEVQVGCRCGHLCDDFFVNCASLKLQLIIIIIIIIIM